LIAVLKSDGVVVSDVTSMCTWTSSNTNVAQVNNGVVTTGRISGTTVITAKYVFGTTTYEKSIILRVNGQERYITATTNIEKVGNLNNVQLKIRLNNGQIINQLYS
jgi:predicted fused transcriptional regulator/phosphomethylpyrimidine kinase